MSGIKRKAAGLIIGKLISLSFQIAVPILLVRLLDREVYGQYQKLLTLSMFFVPFLGLSLNSSMFYFFPISTQTERRKFIAQTLVFPWFASIIILIICTLVSRIVPQFPVTTLLLLLVLTYTTLLITSRLIEVMFILDERTSGLVTFHFFDSICRAIVMVGMAWWYGTPESMFYGLIAYLIIETIYICLYLKKNHDIKFLDISKESMSRQFAYTKPLVFSEIIGKLGANADKYLLAILLTTQEFAAYSVGSFKLSFILLMFTSVGNVILPKLSELHNCGDTRGAFELWKRMVLINCLVTIPTVVFFIGNATPFIELLFSTEYLDSVVVFQIVLSSLLAQMLGHGYLLRAFGENKAVLSANVWRTIISLVFGWILIRVFGMVGGAITFVLSGMVNSAIQLYKSKVILGVSTQEFLPWRVIGAVSCASLLAGGLFMGVRAMNLGNFGHLAVCSIVYFSVMVAWYLHTGLIDKVGLKKQMMQLWNQKL